MGGRVIKIKIENIIDLAELFKLASAYDIVVIIDGDDEFILRRGASKPGTAVRELLTGGGPATWEQE